MINYIILNLIDIKINNLKKNRIYETYETIYFLRFTQKQLHIRKKV